MEGKHFAWVIPMALTFSFLLGYGIFAKTVKNKNDQLDKLNVDYLAVSSDLDSLTRYSNGLVADLQQANLKIVEKNNLISSLQNMIADYISQIEALETSSEEKDDLITELTGQVNLLNSEISNLQNEIQILTAEVSRLNIELNLANARIEEITLNMQLDRYFNFRMLENDTYAFSSVNLNEFGEPLCGFDLVVPSSYNGKPVTQIDSNAISGCFYNTVTLPNTITTLKARAITAEVGSISIPASVTSLESCSLAGCSKVTFESSDLVICANNFEFFSLFNGRMVVDIYVQPNTYWKYITSSYYSFYKDRIHVIGDIPLSDVLGDHLTLNNGLKSFSFKNLTKGTCITLSSGMDMTELTDGSLEFYYFDINNQQLICTLSEDGLLGEVFNDICSFTIEDYNGNFYSYRGKHFNSMQMKPASRINIDQTYLTSVGIKDSYGQIDNSEYVPTNGNYEFNFYSIFEDLAIWSNNGQISASYETSNDGLKSYSFTISLDGITQIYAVHSSAESFSHSSSVHSFSGDDKLTGLSLNADDNKIGLTYDGVEYACHLENIFTDYLIFALQDEGVDGYIPHAIDTCYQYKVEDETFVIMFSVEFNPGQFDVLRAFFHCRTGFVDVYSMFGGVPNINGYFTATR